VSQLEPELQRTLPARVFQYHAQPLRLAVEVEDAPPLVRASVDHSLTLSSKRPHSLPVQLRGAGAPIQELRVQVPAAMTDIDVTPVNVVELTGELHPDQSVDTKVLYSRLWGRPTGSWR